MATDNLNLERCSECHNAFRFNRDKQATAKLQNVTVNNIDEDGPFICLWCAAKAET